MQHGRYLWMNLWLQNDCDAREIPKAVGDWSPDLMPAFPLVGNFSILARRLQCETFRTLQPSRQSWQWTKLAVDFECPIALNVQKWHAVYSFTFFSFETDNELPRASTQRPIHSYLVSNFTCAEAVASSRTVRFSGSHIPVESHCRISSARCARTTASGCWNWHRSRFFTWDAEAGCWGPGAVWCISCALLVRL